MTDAAPAQPPALDPNELLQLPPMKRSEIGNLMACIDRVLRAEGLAAGDLVALAAKLATAEPVSEPVELT